MATTEALIGDVARSAAPPILARRRRAIPRGAAVAVGSIQTVTSELSLSAVPRDATQYWHRKGERPFGRTRSARSLSTPTSCL